MTRPIEAVVAEAQRRLEATGRLDIAAFASAYPEHADELRELLPVMLTLHEEKRWQQAEERSRAFAVSLFAQVAEQPARETVGELFTREREEAGLSLEEQARRTGLPVQALEQLSRDQTPVTGLDNPTIKQLAGRVGASFASLVKEVRRLLSLEGLSTSGQAVFTRDREASTDEEREELLRKVREAARTKPPEEK
ncbi:MAG: helix-turn-helix domain-containing protein [Bacillota bacterium]